MSLAELWFALIAVLWIGYFFLEGFDFGVGMSLLFLGRDDTDRRLMLNSIGPTWDGNEVWVLVAGGATFAAFPEWYATLFSGFYFPLFLILISLIVRVVAFEYRAKGTTQRWRRNWDVAIFVSSLVPSILWGVAFANIVQGVRIGPDHEYAGGFFDLLNPYALLGGVTTMLLFLVHGNMFLALKNTGDLQLRAHRLASVMIVPMIVSLAAFALWTIGSVGHGMGTIGGTVVAALAAVGGAVSLRMHRDGWAFACNGISIAAAVVMLFATLYPDVMPSSIDSAFSLTIANASSTPYTLKVMTVVAAMTVPVVVGYQIWTYWVFRKRLVRPVHIDS